LKSDLEFERENMLTVGRLIEWLEKQPKDSLVYAIEDNTCTYQCLPDVSYLFRTVKDERKHNIDFLKRWYQGTENGDKKAEETNASEFQYVYDENGICLCR